LRKARWQGRVRKEVENDEDKITHGEGMRKYWERD
jgi:hypothetical protein